MSSAQGRWWPEALATRIAVVLVGFVVLATVLVTTAEYARGRAAVRRETRAEVAARAAFAADRLQRDLEERGRLVRLWTALGTSQDLAVDDVDKRLATSLEELSAHFGAWSVSLAADSTGRIVAASDPARIGGSVAAEPWFRPGGGGALLDVSRPGWVVAAAPVRSAEDGHALGQIALLAPWPRLVSGRPGAGRVRLQDASGRLLASTGDPAERGLLWSAPREVRVEGLRLRVSAALPAAAALRPLRAAAVRLAVFALLVLAVTLPALLFMVRSATAELRRLTAAARTAGYGHAAEFAVSPTAPAEVRVLAGSLEAMLARLAESREALSRQESLAAMGTMAAAMAHEIRTPLSVLRGSAEMVGRRAGANSREAELAAFMISEVDRLDRLVNDLLVFARPREPELEPCDLAAVAGRACDTLEPDAERAGVRLERRLEPSPLRGDGAQLHQVALNLIANAVQASPAGAAVEVRVRPEAGGAALEVADRGPGIPPEARERIWTPFFSTRRGGTGLGLPIVRRIVEAHGGRIAVEGEPGRGTRISVRLPAPAPEPVP